MKIAPQPKYHCKKHGEIIHTFHSVIEGKEGRWCMKCFIEMVDVECFRAVEIKED